MGNRWVRPGLTPLRASEGYYRLSVTPDYRPRLHVVHGILHAVFDVEDLCMRLSKRDGSGVSGIGGLSSPLPADGWSASYPGVWTMLTTDQYPDGAKRITSTLLLFFDAGLVKLCLTDRDNDVVGWSVSQKGVEDALQSLEKALQEERVEWRRRKEYSPKGRR